MGETPSKIARRRAAARDDASSGYADRRREIVQVAARVFKERGFRGTTVAHIAEALGADRASLYYYVGSKEELFQAVVSEPMVRNLRNAQVIRDGEGPAPEKLRRLIDDLLHSYGEHYPVLYVLIQENLSHVAPERADWAEEMRRINRDYVDVLTDIVCGGQAEGTIRDTAPAWLLAYGIMGTLGWTNRWFNPDTSPVGADEIGAAFADMLLDGLHLQ